MLEPPQERFGIRGDGLGFREFLTFFVSEGLGFRVQGISNNVFFLNGVQRFLIAGGACTVLGGFTMRACLG